MFIWKHGLGVPVHVVLSVPYLDKIVLYIGCLGKDLFRPWPRPLSIFEMFFLTHNLLHRKIFRKSVKVSDPSGKSVELSFLTFKVKNCFKKLKQIQFEGDAFSLIHEL